MSISGGSAGEAIRRTTQNAMPQEGVGKKGMPEPSHQDQARFEAAMNATGKAEGSGQTAGIQEAKKTTIGDSILQGLDKVRGTYLQQGKEVHNLLATKDVQMNPETFLKVQQNLCMMTMGMDFWSKTADKSAQFVNTLLNSNQG